MILLVFLEVLICKRFGMNYLLGDCFAEDEQIAVGIFEGELVHVPFAGGEGLGDGDGCCEEFRF